MKFHQDYVKMKKSQIQANIQISFGPDRRKTAEPGVFLTDGSTVKKSPCTVGLDSQTLNQKNSIKT